MMEKFQEFVLHRVRKQTAKARQELVAETDGELSPLAREVRDRIMQQYHSSEGMNMIAAILSPLVGSEISFPTSQKISYPEYALVVFTENPNDNDLCLGKPYLINDDDKAFSRDGAIITDFPTEAIPGQVVRAATEEEVEAFISENDPVTRGRMLPKLSAAYEYVQDLQGDE